MRVERPAVDRLVVATKNPDKLVEIEAVLTASGTVGEVVAGMDWPDVEETEDSLEGNALLKAEAVFDATGLPALADDTGLEVAALGGAPGVWSARYAGEDAGYADNVAKMLREMEGASERAATFRTVVALVGAGADPVLVEGRLDGRIARSPRGDRGFGYDPIFEVDGRTLAEMSPEDKNRLSHRAAALRALVERLSR